MGFTMPTKTVPKKRKPAPPPPAPAPVPLAERLADAHAEYRRAREAKTDEPTKTNVEAFHRALGLLNRLEREMKVLQPAAGVMARKR